MAQQQYRIGYYGSGATGPEFSATLVSGEPEPFEKTRIKRLVWADGEEHALLIAKTEFASHPERYLKPTRGDLTFYELRQANVARLPLFKNAKGKPAHSKPDGSDWSIGEWMNATLGELGEAANIVKKIQRGDITFEEALPALKKEFADVQTYLDLTAFRCGIDLGRATIEKWNEVSERVGVELRL